MAHGMTTLLRGKMEDFGSLMSRLRTLLPTDVKPGGADGLFDLAIKYLRATPDRLPARDASGTSPQSRLLKLAKRSLRNTHKC